MNLLGLARHGLNSFEQIAICGVMVTAFISLWYAWMLRKVVLKKDKGTEKMQEVWNAIRLGADGYLKTQLKKILPIIGALTVALFLSVYVVPASREAVAEFGAKNAQIIVAIGRTIAFIMGASFSLLVGQLGMRMAIQANVRAASAARRGFNESLSIAYYAGTITGMLTDGLGLFGGTLIFIVFGTAAPDALLGFGFGGTLLALFMRVGGGIYTKAADVGADLVGKTEANIPEDDPRNPATIADNVGDNVGDVAGLGADLLESYVGAILAGTILACELFLSESTSLSAEVLQTMIFYPVVFAALGLVACVIGTASLLIKKKLSENPHKELNRTTYISAGFTLVFGLVLCYTLFSPYDQALLQEINFRIGVISPWVASMLGIIAGILIGVTAEYYTSYSYPPTKGIAKASKDGVALTITDGMAVGMTSTMAPVAILSMTILLAYLVSGLYGIAMAAVGMLSFVTATVSVDTYGPISDNAGGIAEMSHLDPEVREITDVLDAVGNTTAAIGKGFAIGSAALAATSMIVSYLFTGTPPTEEIILDIVEPLTLSGALIGAALPWMFSGMLIRAVTEAAGDMVTEVRRQFREIKGILTGEVMPDYNSCIQISSQGAIREMRVPAIIAVSFPVICGFIFGAKFVGGLLIGATFSAIMLALFSGNAGGAWDNAKKYVEIGGIEGAQRGDEVHKATVVGDTVGDPLKDTVGPSLNILIKIMSVVALIGATIFSKINLLGWLAGMFG